MSKQLIIESTNKNDTPVDIEEKVQKALESIQLQRENKTFEDPYLRSLKDQADSIVNKVFKSMLDEISDVLTKEVTNK